MPIHEPQNRVSARWLGGAQAASVFIGVKPGANYEMRFTVHHVAPAELASRLQVAVCGRPIKTWLSYEEAGSVKLSGYLPEDLRI